MLDHPASNEKPEWNEKKEEEFQEYKEHFDEEQQEKLERELKEGGPLVDNPELDDTK